MKDWAGVCDTANIPVHSRAAEKVNAVKDAGCGVIDTACRISVAGSYWWNNYKKTLIQLGLGHLTIEVPEDTTYRFGDDGTLIRLHKGNGPRLFVWKTT